MQPFPIAAAGAVVVVFVMFVGSLGFAGFVLFPFAVDVSVCVMWFCFVPVGCVIWVRGSGVGVCVLGFLTQPEAFRAHGFAEVVVQCAQCFGPVPGRVQNERELGLYSSGLTAARQRYDVLVAVGLGQEVLANGAELLLLFGYCFVVLGIVGFMFA